MVAIAACAPPPKPKPPPPTFTPPPPGCGLTSAAFCENFEGARNTVGNRNGDLSTARFSVARWQSAQDSNPNQIGRAQIPACRTGSQSTPYPPGDTLVCDPSTSIRSHYALVSNAKQNYGDNSFRLAQQFDVTGRTGVIAFDTSLYIQNLLVGWPMMAFTADPYNAPSYLADNSAGPTPREGFEVQFDSVCPSSAGWTAFPKVRSYDRYRETELTDENGFGSGCTSSIRTQAGHLNHVVVKLSQTHIEIWMTDASSDGIHFGPLKKVYSAPLHLTFTRGYVYFGVHNHASDKYASLPSWTVLWDNIAFDGPKLVPQRVSQVNDANVVTSSGMNLGYWLPNSAAGATPAFALANVAVSASSSTKLVFDAYADAISNSNWSTWRVNYRFNSGTWHSVGLSSDELALMPRAGSMTFSVAVDPKELHSGTNTVQFSGSNFYAGYQPYIGNIDLIVQ
jgi:hypothetical protein